MEIGGMLLCAYVLVGDDVLDELVCVCVCVCERVRVWLRDLEKESKIDMTHARRGVRVRVGVSSFVKLNICAIRFSVECVYTKQLAYAPASCVY